MHAPPQPAWRMRVVLPSLVAGSDHDGINAVRTYLIKRRKEGQ
jgi:hypothetical protein